MYYTICCMSKTYLNKQTLSVRIDSIALKHVRSKPNYSRYIENLVIADMQSENRKPIVKAVKMELMADEEFFSELVERVIDKSRNYG